MLLWACGGDDTIDRKVIDKQAEQIFMEADSLFAASDYESAIGLYRQALSVFERLRDTVSMSDCYFQISTSYFRIGEFNGSIDMAKKCLHLDSLRNDIESLSSSYNTLAALYLSAKDLKSAMKFIDKAIELEGQTENQEKMSVRYGLASEIYTKADNPEKGLEFAKRAYTLDSISNDSVNMGKRLSQMGDAYAALKQYQQAEDSYIEAARLLRQSGIMASVCINFKQLGNLYETMGNRRKAVEYYEKSVDVARQFGFNYLLESDVSHLATLYGENDPLKGYRLAREALMLKDSIYNEQMQAATQEFSARYDLISKENKITEQENRIQAQRAWLIAVCVFFLLLITSIIFWFYIRYIKREKQYLNMKYYHALTHDFSNDPADMDARAAVDDDVISTTEADRLFIRKVDEIIERCLDDSALSSVRISQEICLGQRQLNRKMRAITGSDTGTYIRDKRILKAKQLLQNTEMAIGEIQTVCGFESPSYFSKVFRDVEGVSPSEFRKKT